MSKRSLIFTIAVLFIVVSATVIPLVIIFYPKNDSNEQQEKTIEELLANIYQATTIQELGSYFTFSIKLQVSMDYLLYIIERLRVHYGEFNSAQAFELDPPLYYYQVVMSHGNITGTISATNSNLVNSFYLYFGPFFDSYITTLTLDEIVDEFLCLSDGGDKSFLLTRDNIVLFNHSAVGKQSVGSIFKLYVLKALKEKITTDPAVTWTTEIPILDTLKSLPSGEMHTWPNGTLASLETFAEYMIKISDNTATDHLIHYLTRDYVETFLPVNYSLPLLKTAEMFKLRYLISDEELLIYNAMNITEKRVYLNETIFNLNINDIYSIWGLNVWENISTEKDIEWFFTTTQIAQILNDVKDLDAMRKNPGLAFQNQWKVVAYKGGGNIGVLTLAHALQATNDTWFTLITFVNNYNQPEFDSYTNLELDIQLICMKLMMFLALK